MAMGFAAFSVDVGYIALVKGQLQTAVDAATLAAAMELNSNLDQATVENNVKAAVVEVAGLNPVGGHPGLLLDPNTDVQLGRRDWDPVNETFIFEFGSEAVPYNLVRVTGRLDHIYSTATNSWEDRRLPMFFAPALGTDKINLAVSSVATFQPRDLMLVLDYSGSMNDDTEFKSIGSMGQQTIEDAITVMWHELGDPSYGSMPFTPTYLTVEGVAEDVDSEIPHVSVNYRGDEVEITSTLELKKVVLRDENGFYKTYDVLSGTTGVFTDNAQIKRVWVESGSNKNLSAEAYGERFNFYDADLVTHLVLNAVTYPYAAGNWQHFVDYVNDDGNVINAGFQYKYGTMCLINYWNEKYDAYSETSDLWKITTQPLSAAKNASDALIDYIQEVEAEDNLGLVIYSHTNANGALLESGLTADLESVRPLFRNRQASHYDPMTNIGAGLKVAREEIVSNARPQAFRMIVLVTDGIANRPAFNPNGYALHQAGLCDDEHIRIMTISLGLGADTSLMQQVADMTGGVHFNVPGGGTIAQYEAQLETVFHQIAADRPLKLLPAIPGL